MGKMNIEILPFSESGFTFAELAALIRSAFVTVADTMCLTPENAPTNPAFIKEEALTKAIEKGSRFYCAMSDGKLLGCVALESSGDPNIIYLERLAVSPEYRHLGIGSQLVDKAEKAATTLGAQCISIGIIDENTVLKNWYSRLSFYQTALKHFDHLPFTVCFMEKRINS